MALSAPEPTSALSLRRRNIFEHLGEKLALIYPERAEPVDKLNEVQPPLKYLHFAHVGSRLTEAFCQFTLIYFKVVAQFHQPRDHRPVSRVTKAIAH